MRADGTLNRRSTATHEWVISQVIDVASQGKRPRVKAILGAKVQEVNRQLPPALMAASRF